MQIKNRQKFLAILAIAGLALLAGDRLLFAPLLQTWKERETRIKKLTELIDQGQKTLDRKAITQNRWNHMRTNTFPSNASLAENAMFKAFDRWSHESRISVSSIKPQWKQTEEDFITLECRADASGNMETLSRFIYEVEKDPLAIRVEAVEITSHDTNGQQLSLGLQVSALLLNPQEP